MLCQREDSGCCVTTCPLVVHKLTSPRNERFHFHMNGLSLKEGWHDKHFDTTVSTQRTDNSQGLNKGHLLLSEVAQHILSENKKQEVVCSTVTWCTVFFCQAIHKHKGHILSQAGLLPKPSATSTQGELTERQTAFAHSVHRVYMTMLKWGDI